MCSDSTFKRILLLIDDCTSEDRACLVATALFTALFIYRLTSIELVLRWGGSLSDPRGVWRMCCAGATPRSRSVAGARCQSPSSRFAPVHCILRERDTERRPPGPSASPGLPLHNHASPRAGARMPKGNACVCRPDPHTLSSVRDPERVLRYSTGY